MSKITAGEAKKRLDGGKNCVLVDVRTGAEFDQLRVEEAILAPVGSLKADRFFEDHPEAKGKELLLLCKSGSRANSAEEIFSKAGYTKTSVISGGITAWQEEGFSVIETKGGVISLERQTRITIGSGILLFTALGYFVHPAFLSGAAFMGAGLVNAGVTDKCPLAIALGMLPWNRGSACDKCAISPKTP